MPLFLREILWVEDKRGEWHGIRKKLVKIGPNVFAEHWKLCGGGKLYGKSRYPELPDFAMPLCVKCRAKWNELMLSNGTVV